MDSDEEPIKFTTITSRFTRLDEFILDGNAVSMNTIMKGLDVQPIRYTVISSLVMEGAFFQKMTELSKNNAVRVPVFHGLVKLTLTQFLAFIQETEFVEGVYDSLFITEFFGDISAWNRWKSLNTFPLTSDEIQLYQCIPDTEVFVKHAFRYKNRIFFIALPFDD